MSLKVCMGTFLWMCGQIRVIFLKIPGFIFKIFLFQIMFLFNPRNYQNFINLIFLNEIRYKFPQSHSTMKTSINTI
jgi:hypothetical protein